MAVANKHKPGKVFDWIKAARMIIAEEATEAEAWLSGDYGYTVGTILTDGKPVTESGAYLSSKWATPMIRLDGGEEQECWRYKDDAPGWDADTLWPAEALAILNEAERHS